MQLCQNCFVSLLKRDSLYKGRNCSRWEQILPFRVDRFKRGFRAQEAQQEVIKVIFHVKMADNLSGVSYSLKTYLITLLHHTNTVSKGSHTVCKRFLSKQSTALKLKLASKLNLYLANISAKNLTFVNLCHLTLF